jgi:trigger factor
MAASDHLHDDPQSPANDESQNVVPEDEAGKGEEKPERLTLQVAIDNRGTCERHITVTVSREDIDRYFEKQFSELMGKAQVPGFRSGHAPRRLVEARFRKDVSEQVKSSLLMDSIAQINEDEDLAAISEPDFDLKAIQIPDEGPMTFEFDLEVRPEFDLPQWKGLKIEKPVREFSDEDVSRALANLLARYGRLVPFDGPAELGDYITTNLTFRHGDQVLSSAEEEVIRVRPVLSFRDGKIANFGQLMVGARAGEMRQAEADLSEDAPNEALRGQKVQATFEVLEVKKLELPELTPDFLNELGGFESEAELRDAVRDSLVERLGYHQHRRARQQITDHLTAGANWDLPPDLLRRQSERELVRAVLELQRSGFGDDEIRAYENELRQNSRQSTGRALKEHFILERIAEEEQIEATPEDYDDEIRLIARQGGETSRRVRSRLEKSGGMDALRNQVVERKVIDLILSQAEFQEVPYEPETAQAEALDRTAGGGDNPSDIPQAKPESASESGAEGSA